MPEIETDRLRHRKLRIEDLSDLMTIVGDSEVMKYLGVEGGTPLSLEEAEDTLKKMIAFWDQRGFAAGPSWIRRTRAWLACVA